MWDQVLILLDNYDKAAISYSMPMILLQLLTVVMALYMHRRDVWAQYRDKKYASVFCSLGV